MSERGFRSIGFDLSGSAAYVLCPGSLFATSANTLVLCPGIITRIQFQSGGSFELEVHDYFDSSGKIIYGGPLSKQGELLVTSRAASRGSVFEGYGLNKPAAFNDDNMLFNTVPSGGMLFEGEWACRHGMVITLTAGAPATCRFGITYSPWLNAGVRKRQNDRGLITENFLPANLV